MFTAKESPPDYKRIYSDLIDRKFPHVKNKCLSFLGKETLSTLDVIKLNAILTGVCSKVILFLIKDIGFTVKIQYFRF